MKLIRLFVLFMLIGFTSSKASAQTKYYDLILDKITLPDLFRDTAIDMTLNIRVFNSKGKELNISMPYTLKRGYEQSLTLSKKIVDVIRGSEMSVKLELYNYQYISYGDTVRKKIAFMTQSSFTLDSEGSKDFGFIYPSDLPKDMEKEFSISWKPVLYWHLQESRLQ